MKSPERLHFLDALRSAAMLAVVALHASVSYMTLRMPDLAWHVYDSSSHPFFDRLFIWVQGFAMPVFFTISGFFAVSLHDFLGEKRFIEHRVRRLFLPFLGCLLVLMPAVYFLWGYGWTLSGLCDLRDVVAGKFFDPEIKRNLYGPGHLWFLEYLMIFTALFAAARRFGWARGLRRFSDPAFSWPVYTSALRPLFFAVPTAAILWLNPGAMFNFRNFFLPEPLRLLHYFIFFIFGAWLHSFRRDLDDLTASAPYYLIFSMPVFALAEICLKRGLAGTAEPWMPAALAISAALFAWLFVFGLLGLFARAFAAENKGVRYAADASYWIYLIHFPFVGAAQILLLGVSWPVPLKFLAVFSSAMVLSLASYEIFVRRLIRPVFAESLYLEDIRKADGARVRLTAFAIVWIVALGCMHQFLYDSEKIRYRREIAGFYRKYFGREADAQGLDYWTMMGVNKYGLARVEREGFIEALAKGAR